MAENLMVKLLADKLEAEAVPPKREKLIGHDDPVTWAGNYVNFPTDGRLTDYQVDIMRTLIKKKRICVRGPHGLGKSAFCALLVLWFATTRDYAGVNWKCITTASAWRQLEKYLWPEIHLWAKRLKWDSLEREPFNSRTELMTTTLRLDNGQAFGGASDNPALLEGLHADSVLIVFDESKEIIAPTWEALEGAMSGTGEVFTVAVSTPGVPSGVFFDIQTRKPGYEDWHVRHVTLDEAIAAGRINPAWAASRARQWGETSAVYQNRVLGEFASEDEHAVIPLAWVEAANERWRLARDSREGIGQMTQVGVDVARAGTDKTVIACAHGTFIEKLRRFPHANTMETTGRVVGTLEANPQARAIVDEIGVGGGVVDRLRELGFRRTVGFIAGKATIRRDRSGELGFVNLRSAAWWWLREQLNPAFGPELCLPDDDELTGDLVAYRYEITSNGKIAVESKDSAYERLKRSTDAGDAVVMAVFGAVKGSGEVWMEAWAREAHDLAEAAPAVVVPQRSYLLGEQPPEAQNPRSCQHRWWSDGTCCRCGQRRADLQLPSFV